MKLTDYLPASLVKVPLVSQSKTEAIGEMVDMIASAGRTQDRDALLKSVLEREAQRTTGIGRGFAIPHAKCDCVENLVIALGLAPKPIDFAAIDGQPVRLIAMLVSPTKATSTHIQALAKLSRLVTNGTVYSAMLEAQSADELYGLLAANDKE